MGKSTTGCMYSSLGNLEDRDLQRSAVNWRRKELILPFVNVRFVVCLLDIALAGTGAGIMAPGGAIRRKMCKMVA